MNFRLMLVLVGVVGLAGCAGTQAKVAPINQVQNQVVDLEQRMEEQEKEIVDLKYELKEVSGKLASRESTIVETSEPAVASVKSSAATSANDVEGLIRVAVASTEIQKALKGAGLYEGKIDGKIGPKTKAAVIEFQKKHNLKADGVIGQKTWSEMKTYLTE
ncbi:MAG: peptidoglycan-binding protein [Candidatus Omnitrophica bacterium]|nr:peptidoglycan-binding protein [Candidatus Omnitrophota bacterium]